MRNRLWVGGVMTIALAAVTTGCAAPYRAHEPSASDSRDDAARNVASPLTPNEASNLRLLHEVQQALNDQGYDAGPVTGRWSTSTDYALRRFQLAQRLPPTGDLDSQTMTALGLAPPAGAAATAGAPIEGAPAAGTTAAGVTTQALAPPASAPRTTTLPPPMTSSGTTPSGMTTPGATSSGTTTRPAAGTPPEQNTGTPARNATQ